MRKQTAGSVETAVAGIKAEMKEISVDRQHFVASLADAMNEVTSLRHKCGDYEEWEQGEEGHAGGDLDAWSEVEEDYTEAAGVSAMLDGMVFMERVRKAAAPLKGPQSMRGDPEDPKDILWAGQKAAQDAANAASDTTHNTKAYEKLSAPAFPKNTDITNWIYSLGTAAVVSGCYGDEKEVTWLRACWSKACHELECSDLSGLKDQLRWRRLVFSLARALQGMIKSSGGSLSEGATLKARDSHRKARFFEVDRLHG